MPGFKVIQGGPQSVLQDSGRFGYQKLGFANGGPLDVESYYWAQRLCDNNTEATAIEILLGGVVLEALAGTVLAITGAEMPVTINGERKELWQSQRINAGDQLEIGFTSKGLRSYLAVSGGFDVPEFLGSSSTVVREEIGGLDGKALQAGQILDINNQVNDRILMLAESDRPKIQASSSAGAAEIVLRVLPGYQFEKFPEEKRQLFFSSTFKVSNRCDRMGYCLNGPDVSSGISSLLSEGICLGAVQVPPDGQPIVLLNDRQTIGGYPKLGSVVSCDISKLAQCGPGTRVRFSKISVRQAHAEILLANERRERTQLVNLEL
ncbi:MAG: biotin-dependent carboxyltransferase [Proteobacteria bacterium]|nr:biotin-dependent carboxyltransferase [Pseudomonadota bacterium]